MRVEKVSRVAMCEVRSKGETTKKPEKRKKKKKYSGQQQKEMDCDEPHPAPNEKTQPIRWTERPTGLSFDNFPSCIIYVT
jgi:hypothetical protein